MFVFLKGKALKGRAYYCTAYTEHLLGLSSLVLHVHVALC